MNAAISTEVRNPAGATVRCRPGCVAIGCKAAFGPGSTRWPEFVGRLSTLPEVTRVEIDRERGTATFHYAPAETALGSLLERLSAALHAPSASGGDECIARLREALGDRRRLQLFRRGRFFSNWQLIHELPGRIRVRDTGLQRRPETMRRLELELHTLPGIETATANPVTGSVLIQFTPEILDRHRLLAALDELFAAPGLIAATGSVPRTSFTLANTTLALATVGELVFPAMLPVSALLLVVGNLSNFRGTWRDLRSRRLGLPALHTAIVAATLASSGFIASSLMNWLLLFWENRHARRLATARQILGATVRRQNRTAWLCRDGVELETPSQRLQPGDVIFVREGDVVPVDGTVISGSALVDESLLRGVSGLVQRSAGLSILRGTQIVEGELRVEVVRCGDDTVAARIGQAIDAATRHTALSLKHHQSPAMADRAVPPALLTATVGLMVGDAATAAAILRPDYATGPGIGGTLLLVQQLGACLQAGLVVRQSRVFADMALVDLVLFDDPLDDGRNDSATEAEEAQSISRARRAFERLRTDCLLQVGLLGPSESGAAQAAKLRLDFHQECDGDESKAAYIARCRQEGHRVAYVGDCRRNPQAAANANVAIAPIHEPSRDADPADVWLLGGGYEQIAWLCEISRTARRQTQVHHGLLLIPNLACVAGAFFFGFTSLAAVVFSNLGTYSIYRRGVTALRETERQLLERRQTMTPDTL